MPMVHAQNSTPYTPPANLSGFPASSVPQWLDTGSNAWMLTAGTLVGLQSLPGLAVFYGGLAKKKYAVNTMLLIFYGFAAVLVVWMIAGYNFGFVGGSPMVSVGKYAIFAWPGSAMSGVFES
ncbi:MAG: ammonium transporter, partial [Nitrososphaerales archaeon]